jgi:AcrR family transcriptional regulator
MNTVTDPIRQPLFSTPNMPPRAAPRAAPAAAPAAAGGDVPPDIVARLGPVVLKTFSVEDFHRVEMRSIARDAGMSFATIYRYFRDKEALLFWFIEYWLRDLYPVALSALDSDERPLSRLMQYLKAHLQFYEARPEIGRVIFMTVPLERWMRDETYRSSGPSRRLLQVIAEGQACGDIRDDVSKVEVFDVWSGVFNRAFLMWEYRGRAYSLVDQWVPLSRVMASGIAGPTARRRAARRPRATRTG